MNRTLLSVLFATFSLIASSQVIGTITDSKGNPLPFVNILIENTYKGTTSNDDGYYELNITDPKTYTIVYTYLGYKTVKKKVAIDKFPYEINISLEEELVSLGEVVVDAENNPANAIMRNAIAKRKENLEKINSYKADFFVNRHGALNVIAGPPLFFIDGKMTSQETTFLQRFLSLASPQKRAGLSLRVADGAQVLVSGKGRLEC